MLRVTDAPGFYAAFPWGGYARDKGATGTRSNAILAHALYTPLSLPPYLPTPGRSFGHSHSKSTVVSDWRNGEARCRALLRYEEG